MENFKNFHITIKCSLPIFVNKIVKYNNVKRTYFLQIEYTITVTQTIIFNTNIHIYIYIYLANKRMYKYIIKIIKYALFINLNYIIKKTMQPTTRYQDQ